MFGRGVTGNDECIVFLILQNVDVKVQSVVSA